MALSRVPFEVGQDSLQRLETACIQAEPPFVKRLALAAAAERDRVFWLFKPQAVTLGVTKGPKIVHTGRSSPNKDVLLR